MAQNSALSAYLRGNPGIHPIKTGAGRRRSPLSTADRELRHDTHELSCVGWDTLRGPRRHPGRELLQVEAALVLAHLSGDWRVEEMMAPHEVRVVARLRGVCGGNPRARLSDPRPGAPSSAETRQSVCEEGCRSAEASSRSPLSPLHVSQLPSSLVLFRLPLLALVVAGSLGFLTLASALVVFSADVHGIPE